MEKITVYRVENSSGDGMYYTGAFNSAVWGNYDEDPQLDPSISKHPPPDQDSRLAPYYSNDFKPSYKFGFASLEQLRFWIYREKWRKRLHENDFRVAVYEALGRVGDTQVFFDPDSATLIETLDLVSFQVVEIA